MIRVGVNLVIEVDDPLITVAKVVEVEISRIVLNGLARQFCVVVSVRYLTIMVNPVHQVPINVVGPALLIVPYPVVVERCWQFLLFVTGNCRLSVLGWPNR